MPAKRQANRVGNGHGMMADRKKGLMSLPDIREGLEAGLEDRKLDVLALDGHWMASAEAVGEFSKTAEYLVSSQNRMNSWRYDVAFDGLTDKPSFSGKKLAVSLAKADDQDSGMTVMNLDKGEDFLKRSRQLFASLEAENLKSTPLRAGEPVHHFHDLYSACNYIADSEHSESTIKAAEKLANCIDKLVVYHKPNRHNASSGVNIYAHPDRRKDNQRFNLETGCESMLRGLPSSTS